VGNLQKRSIIYRFQIFNKYFSHRRIVTEQPRDVYGRFLYKIFHITRRFQHWKWATDQQQTPISNLNDHPQEKFISHSRILPSLQVLTSPNLFPRCCPKIIMVVIFAYGNDPDIYIYILTCRTVATCKASLVVRFSSRHQAKKNALQV